MSWLRRAQEEPAPASLPPPPPAAPELAEHPAPGLKAALAALPHPGAAILDLGPALAANVNFFCRLGARLRIADLAAAFEEGVPQAPPARWRELLPELLPMGAEERFDLVLAWDLVNYAGRERWPLVAAHVTSQLAAGGAIHLLAQVEKEMPAFPARYRIVEPGTISEERRSTARVATPRFSHAEIEKLHPGLVAPRSFLGRHGVQEFLLEPAAAHNLPPRAVAKPRVRTR